MASLPRVSTFQTLQDAIRFGPGYSSSSLIYYCNGDLTFVTPAAYTDYVQNNNWEKAPYLCYGPN